MLSTEALPQGPVVHLANSNHDAVPGRRAFAASLASAHSELGNLQLVP